MYLQRKYKKKKDEFLIIYQHKNHFEPQSFKNNSHCAIKLCFLRFSEKTHYRRLLSFLHSHLIKVGIS